MLQLTKLDNKELLIRPEYIENIIPVKSPEADYTLIIVSHGEIRDLHRVKQTPDEIEQMII